MIPLPPFPVTVVGSWPRPPGLLAAMRRRRRGEIDARELEEAADRAVVDVLRAEEEAGVDLVSDGEQRRDNFYSFVAEKLSGVRLMSLAEMLDIVEDKEGFRRLLDSLDVPAYSIRNPTCVGRVRRRGPLALEELRFLRRHTDRPIKIALPGPYLLTRAMWVKEATQSVYPALEDLAEDIVSILREEVRDLVGAGVDFLQLDEPVLTELVFTQGHTRTFMCAALAARKDPAEELEFAVGLINRVLAGFDGIRTGLHVCRGNWSTREETLLRGSYHPLIPWLRRINVRQLVLEYATDRAGEFVPLAGKEVGLGVVNPRTPEVESVESILRLAGRALESVPREGLFLNPDCGFGTFASRPVNSTEIAVRKLGQIALAARSLRAGANGVPT